ncbi:MAG: 1,4-alpha-glucan branching protein GlgB [Pseudomonadota bacterium]
MTQATRLTSDDLHLYNEGTHQTLYDKLGAHPATVAGVAGTYFAVWAPNAADVSVMGDWNGWKPNEHALAARGSSGIWEGFVPNVQQGNHYKYHIRSHVQGYSVDKADPCGFHHETPPHTASIVWPLAYEWNDGDWMRERAKHNALTAPISIYEVHLASWMRVAEDNNRSLSYRELAPRLTEYMLSTGFTHVEFMPVMEHPFAGSWGYQVTGYFAPTSRFGTPQDFMFLIDHLHQHGIGVILDWVPAHFPSDEHGLAYFDGTHLYEHADPRLGFHPDWKSCIFNYGRNEVRSFLISSALFWLDRYHIDGLRVDGVASMLYRDYSRKAGEWIPNEFGGRENLEAVSLLRAMNGAAYQRFPDTQTIAEESTAWPQVSRPIYAGGLGFGMKWDMGFMHDTLGYLEHDPIHRKYHHNELTFRAIYAYHENFVLPLSHDEVVHGKHSLLGKMPGDEWQRFANLRALYGYMFALPGKKLLFMGGEFGQISEWNHDASLEWGLLNSPLHSGVKNLIADLNRVYRHEPALHRYDTDPKGYEWIAGNDSENSVLSFLRLADDASPVVVIANFTPLPRNNYRLGVPEAGTYVELINTDGSYYGGSDVGNGGRIQSTPNESHGRKHSIVLNLPPLGVLWLKLEPR